MREAYLIFNPLSGSYSAERSQFILKLLSDSGLQATPLLPKGVLDAEAQVRALCETGRNPLIIAVGGDGTLNTVINGLEPNSATLGVIPLGTANVIGYELEIRTVADAVSRIAQGRCQNATVGEVQSYGEARRFILMAGIGIDGAIVSGVRLSEKKRYGKGAYLLSALRRLADWDSSLLTVSDGKMSLQCHTVIVANAAHYGGSFVTAPQASIFAPQLHVIPLTTDSRKRFLSFALRMALTGKAPTDGSEWTIETGEISVVGTKHAQIDGDPFGNGDMRIKVLPDFIEMIV